MLIKLMSNLYCINFTNCPMSLSCTFRLLTDYLHLLFWQFSYVIDAIVLKHLRHLVNIWHDMFYLITPNSLNEKWNSTAGLYLVMKLYLLQK